MLGEQQRAGRSSIPGRQEEKGGRGAGRLWGCQQESRCGPAWWTYFFNGKFKEAVSGSGGSKLLERDGDGLEDGARLGGGRGDGAASTGSQ